MKDFSFIDKIYIYVSQCRAINVISLTTLGVLLMSVPTVYLLASLFSEEYTSFIFFMSIALPLILTPLTTYIFSSYSKHLKHYKKNLEEEIAKSKKKDLMLFEQARFVLMGEMMANISHQWKQPLNNVGLAIVSSRLSDSDEVKEKNFDIMEENIAYLSNTINDFMSFFEKREANDVRNIGEIIDEVQSIMKAQIESRGIKLTINISDKLKTIKMTSIISQVLLNLLNNAKDAIDESKVDKEIVLYFKAVHNGFQVSCCDNGLGINEDVASKIFDPYFTTKEKKQGAGIGLYMSKQIITKIFEGTIVLDDMSKNTCFRIDIPCSKNCQLKEYDIEDLI